MTKPEDVYQGWYIARPVRDAKVGDWCFVYAKGDAPFMSVWPAITGVSSPDWHHNDRTISRGLQIDSETVWEFGERIELPQEVTP